MARGNVVTGAGRLPGEGRVLRGRLLGFDPQLGWGRILGADGRLYLVHTAGIVDGCPAIGATVEFTAIDRGRAWEARRVRRIGADRDGSNSHAGNGTALGDPPDLRVKLKPENL